MLNTIELKIKNHLDKTKCIQKIKKWLLDNNAVLFGGSIKSIWFNESPRDYDIVVSNNANFNILNKYNIKKNSFGGYKIKVNNQNIDIWELDITWAFRNNYFKPTFPNLLNTTLLNLTSVYYDFNSEKLYNKGFIQFLKTKTISLNFEKNPNIYLSLFRIMKLHLQGYNLDKSVINYIEKNYKTNMVEKINQIQYTHYNYEFYNYPAIYNYFEESTYKYKY